MHVACSFIGRTYIDNSIRVNIKCYFNLWYTTRSWRNTNKLESTQRLVVTSHLWLVNQACAANDYGGYDGFQSDAFSLTGGTDAYALWTQNGGIPSAIVSVPNRYMQSTVEVLDLRDLQKAADLLGAFCGDLKKGERFKVQV